MPFQVVRDDITKMKVDVIVNTANPMPIIGSGTDTAIYEAAGKHKLLPEREKVGAIARGDAAITGAYSLPAKYIIHTVGPIWKGGTFGEEEILRSCYEKSLALAVKRKCHSIAFPLISTGNYGFPKDLALQIVTDTVQKFLYSCDKELMVYLVVFGADTTKLSESMFRHIEQRIDDFYAEEKAASEYALNYPSEDDEEAFLANVFGDGQEETSRRRRLREEEHHYFRDEAPLYSMPSIPMESARPEPAPKSSAREKIGSVFKSEAAKPAKKRSLKELLTQQNETFSDMLLRLIAEKGLTNVEAYKRANVDKKLFSKIKNKKDYKPTKQTVMAFALGLELSLDEARDLLARAGFAFSPSLPQDLVVQYCIEEKEYNVIHVECILFELGLETLGKEVS